MRTSLALLAVSTFLALAGQVAAQPRTGQDQDRVPSVRTTATALAEVEYDRAVMTIRFAGEGRDSAALTADLAARLSAFAKDLDPLGVPARDTRFSGPEITIRYAAEGQGPDRRRADGFRGRAEALVETADFARLSRIMATAARHGGLVQGVHFTRSNGEETERRLAEQAAKSAVEQARRLITAVGAVPGRILSIEDAEPYGRPLAAAAPRMLGAAAAETSPADIEVPVRPGKLKIERTMEVRVEILENR